MSHRVPNCITVSNSDSKDITMSLKVLPCFRVSQSVSLGLTVSYSVSLVRTVSHRISYCPTVSHRDSICLILFHRVSARVALFYDILQYFSGSNNLTVA